MSLPAENTSALQGRSVWILLLNIGAFGAMNSVLVSLLPLYGTELGMSAVQITSMSTCAALSVFLCSPYWGRKSDVWGRKPVIALGIGGYAFMSLVLIGVLALGFAHQLSGWSLYGSLWITRVGQALLLAAMFPAASAYMMDITTARDRTIGLGRIGASNGIGAVLGPLLVSLAVLGLLVPLFVAVALAASMALVVWLGLQEPAHNASRPRISHKLSYFDPRYREMLAIGVGAYIALAVSNQTMGFYLPHRLGLAPEQAAASLAMTQGALAASMVFVQLVLLPRLGWSPHRYLLTGIPLVICGYICLLLADRLGMFMLATCFIGLGFGMAGPAYSSEVSLRVRPEEQGAIAGLTASCPALGFVIGPLAAGFLYEIQPTLPYQVTLGILCLLLTLVYKVYTKGRSV